MNDTPLLQAPSGMLAQELAQVKASAEELRRRLREANQLPGDFPKADLDFLAGTLMETPRMSAEGALHALIYGRHKLSDIRRNAVRISPDAARAADHGNASVQRGDMIDTAMNLLVADIGTALDCYGGSSVADAEGPPGGDRVPAAPNDPDYAEIANKADEIADRADAVADAIAGEIDPSTPELKSIELGARDVATLERQTGYELRSARHPGRLERLGNGVRSVLHGIRFALRGVQVGLDIARFAVFASSDLLKKPLLTFLDEANDHLGQLERKLEARDKQWWGDGNGQPRPVFKPFTSFRDRLDDGSQGPEMIVLPAGKFLMGSTGKEQKRFKLESAWAKSESPQHPVDINEAFALGRNPVTFEEYKAYCDHALIEIPSDGGWGRGARPVIYVSHEDASSYCTWLSAQTGAEYRLPSEAEWEYACRAATKTAFWWGEKWDKTQANGDSDLGKTSEVGSYPPSPWGLHDMHGNVWEWCADHWSDSYETPRSQLPFFSDDKASPRVLRGGSWNCNPRVLRSAYRTRHRPDDRYRNIGFRLARTLTS